ncbi:MAG: alcohol dehydrogenase catalytic domain-containing protein [Actinomycetota bacterium]|nr:alcohol dehydrogenase catalytic domain-containing protein [Actinomycetota bacterium]
MPSDPWASVALPRELPGEMTAVRVHRFGAPPQVDQLPVPQVGDGEVLVKMVASVVSHHDLTVAGGEFAVRPALPYTPGLEGAGLVARLGEGVALDAVAPGSPVRLYGGGLGASRPGTWAQYVVAPARAVLAVPRSLRPDVAAACGSVALTAWVGLFDVGDAHAGERLGVSGATGAVGSLVVQLAIRHGIDDVVAWVRSKERARDLPPGVEVLVDDAKVEPPLDLLVDTVGGPLLPGRIEAVRAGGRAVVIGYTAGQEVCLTIPDFLARDVPLLPLNMMRRRPARELESRLVDQFAAGELKVATDVVEARNFLAALGRLQGGGSKGRAVILW